MPSFKIKAKTLTCTRLSEDIQSKLHLRGHPLRCPDTRKDFDKGSTAFIHQVKNSDVVCV